MPKTAKRPLASIPEEESSSPLDPNSAFLAQVLSDIKTPFTDFSCLGIRSRLAKLDSITTQLEGFLQNQQGDQQIIPILKRLNKEWESGIESLDLLSTLASEEDGADHENASDLESTNPILALMTSVTGHIKGLQLLRKIYDDNSQEADEKKIQAKINELAVKLQTLKTSIRELEELEKLVEKETSGNGNSFDESAALERGSLSDSELREAGRSEESVRPSF